MELSLRNNRMVNPQYDDYKWLNHNEQAVPYMAAVRSRSPASLELMSVKRLLMYINTESVLRRLHFLPSPILLRLLRIVTKAGMLVPKLLLAFADCNLTELDFTAHTPVPLPFVTMSLLVTLPKCTNLSILTLDQNAFIENSMLSILKALPKLRSLSLARCHLLSNELFSYVKDILPLKHLNVAGNVKVSSIGLQTLTCSGGPQLISLDLSDTRVDDSVFSALLPQHLLSSLSLDGSKVSSLQHLGRLTQLETLCLRRLKLLTGAAYQITQLTVLARLYMQETWLSTSEEIPELLKMRHLVVFQPPVAVLDTRYKQIADMLLTSLDLAGQNFGNEDMSYLSRLTMLKELNLSSTRVTSLGLKHLCTLTRLSHLSLGSLQVEDGSLGVLRFFPDLISLSLSKTLVGDDLLLTNVLNGCQRLQQLDLSGTVVTDKGLASLSLKKLHTLILDETSVSVAAALTLASSRCISLFILSLVSLQNLAEAEDFFDEDPLPDEQIE